MSRRSGSSNQNPNKLGDGCFMPFHHIQVLTLAATTGTINCNPTGLSSRALSEADNWAHFRLRRLKFRIHPQEKLPTAGTNEVSRACVGYVGGMEDTAPATATDIMELLPSLYLAGYSTIPTKWMTISPKDLAGPLPWYKTIPGTADVTEESPGQLCYVLAGSGSVNSIVIEWSGIFEFKTSVSATNTPLSAKLREMIRDERRRAADEIERKKLQQVLTPVPSKTPSLILP
jgi:hypothetical protein